MSTTKFDFVVLLCYKANLTAYSLMPIPQEMSNLHPQDATLENWLASPATPVRDIQKYMHLIAYKNYPMDRVFPLARVALDVHIADQAENAANKLAGQTDGLMQNVAALVTVAKEQKELAQKLDRQTDQLITLTRVLVVLTIVLFLLGTVQTCIMFKENAQANVQHIERGQGKQGPQNP